MIDVKWTKLAKECYEIDCNCGLCFYRKFLESECVMGNSVQTLLNRLGNPPEKPELPNHYSKVYEYIKNKRKALLEDILKDLDMNKNSLFVILSGLRWHGITIRSDRKYIGRVNGRKKYNYWYRIV